MVFDVDKLKEALVDLEDVKIALEASGEWDENDTDAVALEVLRMVAAGQPLWRCEEHNAESVGEPTPGICWRGVWRPTSGVCRMVEGWWMPTGKDET